MPIKQTIGVLALFAMVVPLKIANAAPPRAASLPALEGAIAAVASEAARTRTTAGIVVGAAGTACRC